VYLAKPDPYSKCKFLNGTQILTKRGCATEHRELFEIEVDELDYEVVRRCIKWSEINYADIDN
jgi:hypothetical protein